MNTLYTLFDGTKMTINELQDIYTQNVEHGRLPTNGYFCPKCHHQIDLNGPNWCSNCGCKDKPEIL